MRGTLTAVAQLRARHRLAARCRGPAYSSAVEGPDGNDIPPTGESFKIDFCTVAHWVDGKIVEENLFYDLWVWCNSSDSAKTTCSGHADRLPVPTSGGVPYLVTSSPDLFGCCPENATSRMVGSGAGAVTLMRSVSSPRPSNRACGSPAHGSPTPFTGGVRPEPARPGWAWVRR